MTQKTEAGQSGREESAIVVRSAPDESLTTRKAARSLVEARRQDADAADALGTEATDASANLDSLATQSADHAGTGESEKPSSGETGSTEPAAELPPIELPKSWTKEDKELFASLPRAAQERLAERERSRDSDFSHRQQEATERAKALTAEYAQVEKARASYEQALPILLNGLQALSARDFPEVRTPSDAEKLAKEDGARYVRWDALQKQIAAIQDAIAQTLARRQQDREQWLSRFKERERVLLIEKMPELADEAQEERLRSAAVSVLSDLGFGDAELDRLWSGEKEISLHDHRLQLLLRDGIRWREAQAKAKAAQAKPVPPVVRPGAAQTKSAAREAELQELNKKLDGATGMNALRTAAQILAARRQATR